MLGWPVGTSLPLEREFNLHCLDESSWAHLLRYISPQGRVTPVVGLLANPRLFGNPVPFTLHLELLSLPTVLYLNLPFAHARLYQMNIWKRRVRRSTDAHSSIHCRGGDASFPYSTRLRVSSLSYLWKVTIKPSAISHHPSRPQATKNPTFSERAPVCLESIRACGRRGSRASLHHTSARPLLVDQWAVVWTFADPLHSLG